MSERQVDFENDRGRRLHGILCGDVAGRDAVLMCYPFADERKCAQRAYVCLARKLAEVGVGSLRFDYSGCGNSEGRFAEALLSDWVDDTRSAFAWLAGFQPRRLMAMGVRLGANIALRAAEDVPMCRRLLLWNLLADAGADLASQKRRNRVLRMFSPTIAHNPNEAADVLDLAGYAVSAELIEQFDTWPKTGMAELSLDRRIVLAEAGPNAEPIHAGMPPDCGTKRLHAKVGAFWTLSHVRHLSEFLGVSIKSLCEDGDA